MPDSDTEIEVFLAALPPDSRSALEDLRGIIRESAPDTTERIGYGVPAFYYRGRPLVSYGAAKNHCSFYVQSPTVLEAHIADLDGFDTSKGTVRFRPDRTLPAALVTKLVRARMAEIDAARPG
jgi:uncharacterized protein YdhG (YjbR/CyaY superfamily)